MKNKFVNSSINIINNNNNYSESELKKLRYGLEGFYSFITKFIIILLINIILKTFIEFIILFIAFAIIRAFAFGIHAKSNIGCWVVTLIIYSIIPYLIKTLIISKTIQLIITIVSIIIIIIYAPADTKKRPLIHKDKRIQDKIIATCICLIYLLFVYFNNNQIIYCFIYSLLLEAIMVNPLTYLLSKQSFNNYKKSNV